MAKFEIGARVKVNNSNGDRHVGQCGTVNEKSCVPYVILDGGELWAFVEEELDLIVEPKVNKSIFKVGDKVLIKKDWTGLYNAFIDYGTANMGGKIGTIESIGNFNSDRNTRYYTLKNSDFSWPDTLFEKVITETKPETKYETRIAKVGERIYVHNPDDVSKRQDRGDKEYTVDYVVDAGNGAGYVDATGNGHIRVPFTHKEYKVIIESKPVEPTKHKWTGSEIGHAKTISKCILLDLFDKNLSVVFYEFDKNTVKATTSFGTNQIPNWVTAKVSKYDEFNADIGKCVALHKLVGNKIPDFITHAKS